MCDADSSGSLQIGQTASAAERIFFFRREARERIRAWTRSQANTRTFDGAEFSQT
jgi:hypothetical protein